LRDDESHFGKGSGSSIIFLSAKKEIAVNKGHLAALQMKHAELETQLEVENARPFPNDDLIHRLKKLKLQIKDQLLREPAPA
jgi:hypothetical protein